VPSVKYGKVTFDVESRRVLNPRFSPLVVKDNQFVKWDGTKPSMERKIIRRVCVAVLRKPKLDREEIKMTFTSKRERVDAALKAKP
jgi:hypothetical protein